MNRGDRRGAIFNDDKDRGTFLDTLGDPRDLQGRRKGDPQKVRVAARLRCETTMTLEWIVSQLHMGAPAHLAMLLQLYSRKDERSENT
jgi:hypothetical protein